MPRIKRACQFAPFDALKGLQTAMRIKEYQHESVIKGEVQEDKAREISNTLMQIKKYDKIKVRFFCDGHYHDIKGEAFPDYDNGKLRVKNEEFNVDVKIGDIFEVEII